MKVLKLSLMALGVLCIPVLLIMALDGKNDLVKPAKLQYDIITVNAQRLREARAQSNFETIILHSDYDGDWPDPDDVHLLPSAWRNQAGPDDFRAVAIDERIFERNGDKTLDAVIGSSVYFIPTEYLDYYLDPGLRISSLTLSPDLYSLDNAYVQYIVSAVDDHNQPITLNPRYVSLNPSPPAKPGIR